MQTPSKMDIRGLWSFHMMNYSETINSIEIKGEKKNVSMDEMCDGVE